MKASIECYPCLMGQVLSTVNLCDLNDKEKKDVMVYALTVLASCSDDVYPQEIVVKVNDFIIKSSPQMKAPFDPYKEIKSKSRQMVLQFYDTIHDEINSAGDRIEFEAKCPKVANALQVEKGAMILKKQEKA